MIVGITGRKRAGKDTAAQALRAIGWAQDSFAAPMRRFVADMLGWDAERLERDKEAPLHFLGGITARHLMQTVGTEWGRAMIDRDLWLKLLMQRVAGVPRVVVSDVRFDNEAQAIRDAGGIVIEIQRASASAVTDEHVSEGGVSQWLLDNVIHNDGTPDDLGAKVREVVATFYARKGDA